MSQIGRQLETPRPLKSSIKQQAMPLYQQQQSFEVNSIEDLIALIEAVANSLSQGDVSLDLFNKMFSSLSLHGPQLEIYSKEILDRCFIVYRNASQDDRLKISIRLNLLNLIELRANSWQLSDGLNTYYKQKAATNVEPDNDMNMLGTSPSINMGMTLIGQALAPGEIVKNSGKFAKPTKIPGKNYSKDEIIIRNADSGKVMGIKGRRVHIIEEMSNCVISFQRVNPGAKERLVQITGPSEESINYAKLLIEDTIKRNASPIREASQEGSCSSLASSDDQQVTVLPRTRMAMQQHINVQLPMGNKLTRSNSHHNNSVFHSLSTNDASLGEYKYTVNVGNHSIKITGDSLELVKVAKLVLDDFFTQQEFLKSSEAMMLNAEAASSMIPLGHQLPSQSSPFIDSGVHLDLLARSSSNAVVQLSNEVEDDVFMQGSPNNSNDDVQVLTSSSSIDSSSSSNTTVVTEQINAPANGLSRSRRSHFSRKDSTPEMANKVKPDKDQIIVHTKKSLWWFYQNLPLCKGLPTNYDYIREKIPAIIRDKNSSSSSETSSSAVVRYSDAEKFLEKRTIVESSDDVIEVDDDD